MHVKHCLMTGMLGMVVIAPCKVNRHTRTSGNVMSGGLHGCKAVL